MVHTKEQITSTFISKHNENSAVCQDKPGKYGAENKIKLWLQI